MTPKPAPVHEFGPFRYDPGQRLLFREGELVSLPPKAVDLLHVLLERRGVVTGKAELMSLVWPDTLVEEIGLARNVSILRKALGEESGAEAFIETIPKRGYRFVAAAGGASAEPPARRKRIPWRWAAGGVLLLGIAAVVYWQFYVPSRFLRRGPEFASVAVVPFQALTPELERSALIEGLNELLVASLSQVGGISVVGPSTVRRHQRAGMSMGMMGRLLGLDALVEGTVQQMAGNLSVNARLVDVHTGRVIWADSFRFPASEPERAQREAVRDAVAQISAHLSIHRQFR